MNTTTITNHPVVNLWDSGNYAILAKDKIINIPPSIISGDLGVNPIKAWSIYGLTLKFTTHYATSTQVIGKVYGVGMASPTLSKLSNAIKDMRIAYTNAAERVNPDYSEMGGGNIGGFILAPGLYKWSGAVTIPANVTLSGGPNDVWIFQIAGTLDVSREVSIILRGGAQAKNIFWAVADAVTFGTNSHFEGIVLAATSIACQCGASINGNLLAQTVVMLDSSTVRQAVGIPT